MKRLLVVGSVVAVLALLIISVTTPVFAHGPNNGDSEADGSQAYAEMHRACTEGDWDAMVEAAEEVHGEEFSGMPCHEETDDAHGGMMGGGMMGGGMMGGGMMGSMY